MQLRALKIRPREEVEFTSIWRPHGGILMTGVLMIREWFGCTPARLDPKFPQRFENDVFAVRRRLRKPDHGSVKRVSANSHSGPRR